MPDVPVILTTLAVATQREAIMTGMVDAALVRLPIEREGLSVVKLYDELPVVVCAVDSHLTAAEELDLDDLAGEVVMVPGDDVLTVEIPGAVSPAFDSPVDTRSAIELVASGVGIVVVPQSLARAFSRKDVATRVLRKGPESSVALAWRTEATSPLVEAFVWIVRGRTANSSRG